MLDRNPKSCWSVLTVSVLPFSKIGEGALFSLKKEVNDEATGHSQLTMQVVEHVRALISSGEVHPGDRPPPARELAGEAIAGMDFAGADEGEVHPGDRLPPERELARKLKI